MTESPKKPRMPIVIRQHWVTVTPDGTVFDGDMSYHLTEPDRVAMVSEVASRSGMNMETEREEPTGDPEPIHTTEEHYQKIRATTHGLRVR